MAARKRSDGDTVTPPRARMRNGRPALPGAPLTAEERAAAQDVFLATFARYANVSQAAKRARISRKTVYEWLDSDEAFKARYVHADADAQDVLRKETFRRAVVGVPEPLTNAQGLVYEYEPVIGPDGEPELDDRGRPKMKRGKAVTVKKYSDGLLQAMLKARVPEYRDKKQVEVSGPNGGPIETKGAQTLAVNLDGMSVERLRALRDLLDEDGERDGDSGATGDQPNGIPTGGA